MIETIRESFGHKFEAGDKKRSRGSRFSRICKSRCLIRMGRDFKDGDVCSTLHVNLTLEDSYEWRQGPFKEPNFDTMKTLKKNMFFISLISCVVSLSVISRGSKVFYSPCLPLCFVCTYTLQLLFASFWLISKRNN